jgi:hypothetical protein
LGSLRSVWWQEPEQVTNGLKALTRSLFSKLVIKLGWEYKKDETHLTALLRTLAISAAGKSEDPATVTEAKKRFQAYVANPQGNAIHPNLRGAVFSIILKNGDEKDYEQVLDMYRQTSIADQKIIALGSLGAPSNPKLLERSLQFCLTPEVQTYSFAYRCFPCLLFRYFIIKIYLPLEREFNNVGSPPGYPLYSWICLCQSKRTLIGVEICTGSMANAL